MNFPNLWLIFLIIFHCQFCAAINSLTLTDAQKLIDFLAQNYEKNSPVTIEMKTTLLKILPAKEHSLQAHLHFSPQILGQMRKMLGPMIGQMPSGLAEDDQFRFVLSRLFPFGRLLIINFLRLEAQVMMEFLAEKQKRWDIVRYMAKLEQFDKETVKLLNWMQTEEKFKWNESLWNIQAVQSQVKQYSMVIFKPEEEDWTKWYTVEKQKREFQPILLIKDEAAELFKVFVTKRFEKLKENNEEDAFKKFFKNSYSLSKNKVALKATEFVMERTTAALEETNLVLLKTLNEDEISIWPGQALLTYQEQNIVILGVFYKFAIGLIEQILPKKANKSKEAADILIRRISEKWNGSLSSVKERRKRGANVVEEKQIYNLRRIQRKISKQSEIRELNSTVRLQLYLEEFERRFKALREEIGEIANFKGGVECLDSMDYSTYFKVVQHNLARFTTNLLRTLTRRT